MGRQKAEIVNIKPDVDRIVAAISYIIHVADDLGAKFSQYDVVKSMFLADRAHLNEYGRLISSDMYVAMKHGPVPTTAYNLLKGDQIAKRTHGIDDLPWQVTEVGGGKKHYHAAEVGWVDDFLAPSDKSAIATAVAKVKSLSFGQIRHLTHEDPAYLDAWEEGTDRKQFPMSLGLLFEKPNFERAREIQDISQIS
ncbi:Panacea domain-containing protein [Phyllobacterium sp. 22229]|uniref:Panacea domain-containing protein n=1 Tax=Phyllobacterium sp. 22229 TaxID=3453895 RepID=UPI003F826E20